MNFPKSEDEDEKLCITDVLGEFGAVVFNQNGTINFVRLCINGEITVENVAQAVINTLTDNFLAPLPKEMLN